MRTWFGMGLALGMLGASCVAVAQGPGGRPGSPQTKPDEADDLVARMMAFDADKDGKLQKEDVGDRRLHRLFDRADADKDGTVTKAELSALAEREHADDRGGPFGGGPGGPPGFGGPPGGGMPRIGEVFPPMARQRLAITPEQAKELDALQKDVDARLQKILTEEQRTQLKEMRDRGPGDFGPPGGRRPGGPGGPGGGPPWGFGGPPPDGPGGPPPRP